MKLPIAIFLTALLFTQTVRAAEPVPFTPDSLAKIQAKYAGRPFILSMWSVDGCTHCITELTMYGKLVKKHKNLPLVLVSTDTPEFTPALIKTTKRLGLKNTPSWVFNDDIPERLRAVVDPAWRGELPRTYLYDARHQREVVSGVLNEAKLRAWMKQHL